MSSTILDRPRRHPAPVQLGRHRRELQAEAAPRLHVVEPAAEARSRARHAARVSVGVAPVLGRVLGVVVAAAAVTAALASRAVPGGTAGPDLVAQLSVGGVGASTLIAMAWAFQDRRAFGTQRAARTWTAVAGGVGLAHATYLVLAVPGDLAGTLATRGWTGGATIVMDALIIAVPALLGIRAGAAPTPREAEARPA